MSPRIPPLANDEMTEIALEMVERYAQGGRIDNVFRTVAQHPDLLKRWIPFVNHVLFKSTLPVRDREILILRIGWLCRSEYEWAQHVRAGRRAGLSDDDIDCIMAGRGLSDTDDALLRATDELHVAARISDQTWIALSSRYSTQQMMDIVYTVGQYTLVSMALNSFGVEVDEYLAGYPPVPAR